VSATVHLDTRNPELSEPLGRAQLETQLEQLHGQIRLNQIQAGRIISELRRTLRHGEWMPYSENLFARLKISRKSAERYVDAYQKAKDIGEPILQEAEAAGLNISRIPVQEALLESKNQDPTAPPSKIVKMTNLKLQQEQKKETKSPTTSSVVDLIAVLTVLRSKLSGTNQIVKRVQNGSADLLEVRTLESALRALATDALQRADRLAEAIIGREDAAA
jgi:hypothetical protein